MSASVYTGAIRLALKIAACTLSFHCDIDHRIRSVTEGSVASQPVSIASAPRRKRLFHEQAALDIEDRLASAPDEVSCSFKRHGASASFRLREPGGRGR